jgi:catechol 2,3-dioxygenase-like lactoylglutathione lyase family enzyme
MSEVRILSPRLLPSSSEASAIGSGARPPLRRARDTIAREVHLDIVQVRYIVDDVAAAVEFYCGQLGFAKVMHPAPTFAMLTRGALRVALSAHNPSAGGGQPIPDGRAQAPGGWNRFAVAVEDLESEVARLRAAGGRLRNDIVAGVGGKQILLEDPSGNPIELFQPTAPAARFTK